MILTCNPVWYCGVSQFLHIWSVGPSHHSDSKKKLGAWMIYWIYISFKFITHIFWAALCAEFVYQMSVGWNAGAWSALNSAQWIWAECALKFQHKLLHYDKHIWRKLFFFAVWSGIVERFTLKFQCKSSSINFAFCNLCESFRGFLWVSSAQQTV